MEVSGLLNKIEHLFNNKKFSDVEYRVKGTDGQYQSFYAHKLILAMAGERFEEIFYDSRREQLPQRKITEFTPHVFELMLRYIYTDKIKIPDLGDAMNIFQLASFFAVKGLMEECDSFLNSYQVDHDSVFAKYDCALVFKNRPLLDACRKLVSYDTEAVFRSEYFCMASRNVIDDILKLDRFTVSSEVDIIEAVLKWCKADCKRKYGSTEYLYVRDSFMPFCKNIRFLTLEIQEFFDFVDNHELLLTKHEIDQFTARLFNKADHKISIPPEFTVSRVMRRFMLEDSSSSSGSVKSMDTSHSNSSKFYSYPNGDGHLRRASPNESLSNFPLSNGANANQSFNDTAKKNNTILSYTAQSNAHDSFMKANQNVKQAPSQPLRPTDMNGFIKWVNSSFSGSSPVNSGNNFGHSYNVNRQAQNFPSLPNGPHQVDGYPSSTTGPRQVNSHLNYTNGPRQVSDLSNSTNGSKQVNGHSNSTNSKVPQPATSTYSSHPYDHAPASNGPLYEVLPKRRHTPTLRVMPQPVLKNVMSYEIQLHEMRKQMSSSCNNDIKCHVDIKMLRGTILIHGIELKVQNAKSSTEDDLEVFLCITSDESPQSYSKNVRPSNNLLRLPFNDPIAVSQNNPVDIEVIIDDLKVNRCGVCRAQEMRAELNSGLDVKAEIQLRSNQSGGNDSFVFLISKILYSVPK